MREELKALKGGKKSKKQSITEHATKKDWHIMIDRTSA